jgi:hypothetical protein
MKIKLLLFGLMFIGFVSLTSAQSTPAVDTKQKAQKVRIAEGVKSGELTKRETRKLAKQQARVRRTERKAKADGKVTAQERRELRRKQRRSSANIHHKKNNTQSSN